MQSTQQTATAPGGAVGLAQRTEPNCVPTARSHQAIHRFRVRSADVGRFGGVDGGKLFDWIYQAAHAVAVQWCGRRCVVASVGNVHLDRPIAVGELVDVHACIVYTGHRSVHLLITVCSDDPVRAKAVQTSQCPMIFVAVDDNGNAVEVPPWTPVTILELQRQRQARVRIRMRKRIEDAMAAQTYSAEGTAPCATQRFVVPPTDPDEAGEVAGGLVMRWMDEVATVCAAHWAGGEVVTAYSAGIRFLRPITVGDTIGVTARVIHTGPRSIHCGIRVTATNARDSRPRLVAQAVGVRVTLDEHGNAGRVPRWEPSSDEDHRLDQHATHLIELRQFIEPFTTVATTHWASPAEPPTGKPRVQREPPARPRGFAPLAATRTTGQAAPRWTVS